MPAVARLPTQRPASSAAPLRRRRRRARRWLFRSRSCWRRGGARAGARRPGCGCGSGCWCSGRPTGGPPPAQWPAPRGLCCGPACAAAAAAPAGIAGLPAPPEGSVPSPAAAPRRWLDITVARWGPLGARVEAERQLQPARAYHEPSTGLPHLLNRGLLAFRSQVGAGWRSPAAPRGCRPALQAPGQQPGVARGQPARSECPGCALIAWCRPAAHPPPLNTQLAPDSAPPPPPPSTHANDPTGPPLTQLHTHCRSCWARSCGGRCRRLRCGLRRGAARTARPGALAGGWQRASWRC
jgi:hypothetical protein